MYRVTLSYQIATYSGEVTIDAERDDQDHWIAVAKRNLTRQAGGSLPFGCERWRVESVEEV